MSEILVINTKAPTPVIESYEPYNVYDEHLPLLKTRMPDFNFINPWIDPKSLSIRLLRTLKHYNGLGLSANQCALPFRVFVMMPDIVCFNPRIVETGPDAIKPEGCLSFPGMTLKVPRPTYIIAEYEDANGTTIQKRFEGMTAQCYMHELDHMNGVRFIEKISQLKLQMARKKQKKMLVDIKRRLATQSKVQEQVE
jgi:peptide deformylase